MDRSLVKTLKLSLDGGSKDGMHESQRAARGQDLDAGERRSRRGRLLGIKDGKGGGSRELAVVAEHRHGASERLRRGAEASESPQHGPGQRLGAQL